MSWHEYGWEEPCNSFPPVNPQLDHQQVYQETEELDWVDENNSLQTGFPAHNGSSHDQYHGGYHNNFVNNGFSEQNTHIQPFDRPQDNFEYSSRNSDHVVSYGLEREPVVNLMGEGPYEMGQQYPINYLPAHNGSYGQHQAGSHNNFVNNGFCEQNTDIQHFEMRKDYFEASNSHPAPYTSEMEPAFNSRGAGPSAFRQQNPNKDFLPHNGIGDQYHAGNPNNFVNHGFSQHHTAVQPSEARQAYFEASNSHPAPYTSGMEPSGEGVPGMDQQNVCEDFIAHNGSSYGEYHADDPNNFVNDGYPEQNNSIQAFNAPQGNFEGSNCNPGPVPYSMPEGQQNLQSSSTSVDEFQTPNDVKRPEVSYTVYIGLAMKNSKDGILSVPEIWRFLCYHFPFFRGGPAHRKNVSDTVSKNTFFKKYEDNLQRNKNTLWQVIPEKAELMVAKIRKYMYQSINLSATDSALKTYSDLRLMCEGRLGMPPVDATYRHSKKRPSRITPIQKPSEGEQYVEHSGNVYQQDPISDECNGANMALIEDMDQYEEPAQAYGHYIPSSSQATSNCQPNIMPFQARASCSTNVAAAQDHYARDTATPTLKALLASKQPASTRLFRRLDQNIEPAHDQLRLRAAPSNYAQCHTNHPVHTGYALPQNNPGISLNCSSEPLDQRTLREVPFNPAYRDIQQEQVGYDQNVENALVRTTNDVEYRNIQQNHCRELTHFVPYSSTQPGPIPASHYNDVYHKPVPPPEFFQPQSVISKPPDSQLPGTGSSRRTDYSANVHQQSYHPHNNFVRRF